jgi:predicted RNA-binding Zn ribbon-like protein
MAGPITQAGVHKFQLLGGHLALDFVNTLDNRGSDQQKELITGYQSLIAFLEQTQAISAGEARHLQQRGAELRDQVGMVVTRAHYLRESLYTVLTARIDGREPAPEHLKLVSSFWREAAEQRVLVPGPDKTFQWGWLPIGRERWPSNHPNYFRTEHDDIKAPLWRLAAAAGELMTSQEMANLRRCASNTCNWLFLDKTKSHTRRWCEMRVCGNRDKAARFYRKHKAR